MRKKTALTTGEIARYCAVNFRTVLRWIESGSLKSYKLPGRGDNRVRIEDFLDFLSEHDMPVPEEFAVQRRLVLIVEDEPHMARSISRVLQRDSFETLVATNGFRAGALLGTFCPEVVTLDLQMPGLGGLEVLSFVRATSGLEKVKILVVSAVPERNLEEALVAGADDVLSKPFENAVLLEKVSRLVSTSGANCTIQAMANTV